MKLSARKWMIEAAVLFYLLMVVLPVQVEASSTVKASIPPFPVKINGQVMDQIHSRYPFLFYQDITYLPLTWNNLQTLGILSEWTEEEGLLIEPNRNFPPPIQQSPPEQDLTNKSNSSLDYSVHVSEGPITMNQTPIHNETEPYPFLTFRDVTYMPLTWHFVHDLLQIDIRWSDSDGLQLIGGQNVFGSLISDDDRALYFYSLLSADPAKSMIKMDKTSFHLEWKGRKDQDDLIKSLTASPHPLAGKPAELQRKDRDLYYGDLKIYTLTDADVWESDIWGAPIQTYTEYQAGKQGVIISINLKRLIAVTSTQDFVTTYNILVLNGEATVLKDFNQKPDRVIPNADGTVWIASSGLPDRNGKFGKSACLALLDRDGNVHIVNEQFNESSVLALGLTNPSLSNPAAADGSLYVVLSGHKKENFSEQESAGLYTLNTKLEAVRMSDHVAGEYYLDKSRNIYIQQHNNTIVNGSTGESHAWFDYELAHME